RGRGDRGAGGHARAPRRGGRGPRVAARLPGPALGSRRALADLIADGNRGVRRIPGKHGGGTDSFVTLTVLVPDRPGELGRLLTEMGEIGVNLEDLHLEHNLGKRVGLAPISIDATREELLPRSLDERGWAVAER